MASASRPWTRVLRRTGQLGTVGVFAVALMLDAIQVGELDRIGLVKLVSCAVVAGLACAATLRWARDATDSGRAPAPTIAGAIVVAAASLAWLARPTGARSYDAGLGLSELGGLAVLVALTVRLCRPAHAAAGAAAVLAAVAAALIMRGPLLGTPEDPVYVGTLLTAAACVGLYLRALDRQAGVRADAAREQERLALARDLHDAVAHHVTGIVVRAQAAQHVATREPAACAPAEIEHSGAEALAAMRRLVGALRLDDGATRRVEPLEHALQRLVTTACANGLPARLDVASPAMRPVPAEIATSVEHVVQEALTNAHRYAHDATQVLVRLRLTPGEIQVTVRDDGRARPSRFPGAGGAGLVGLRERIDLLGGRFDAGALPSGWNVDAVVPLPGATR